MGKKSPLTTAAELITIVAGTATTGAIFHNYYQNRVVLPDGTIRNKINKPSSISKDQPSGSGSNSTPNNGNSTPNGGNSNSTPNSGS
jgi:hypothetical protein